MKLKTMSNSYIFIFALLLISLIVSFDAGASNVYDGTWSGTATSSNSEGGTITIQVSSDAMTSFALSSFVVKGSNGCYTTTNMTATGSVSVSSGSFSVTFSSTYNTFVFGGTLSSSGSASGTWSTTNSYCNSSSSGTWTATRSGGATASTTTTTTTAVKTTTTTTAVKSTTTTTTGIPLTTTTGIPLTTTTTTTATSTSIPTTFLRTISYSIPYLHTNTNNVVFCMVSNNSASASALGVLTILSNSSAANKPTQVNELTGFPISAKQTAMVTFSGSSVTSGSTTVDVTTNTDNVGVNAQSIFYSAKLAVGTNDTTATCDTIGMTCFQGTTTPRRNIRGYFCYDGYSYSPH